MPCYNSKPFPRVFHHNSVKVLFGNLFCANWMCFCSGSDDKGEINAPSSFPRVERTEDTVQLPPPADPSPPRLSFSPHHPQNDSPWLGLGDLVNCHAAGSDKRRDVQWFLSNNADFKMYHRSVPHTRHRAKCMRVAISSTSQVPV